jgi:hypothetical protein
MSASRPLLERMLPLYVVIAARVYAPWTMELARSLPGRIAAYRRRSR